MKIKSWKRDGKEIGLGDAVAKVATPIARALGMSCVDKETGKLKPESNCAQRQKALNEWKEKPNG